MNILDSTRSYEKWLSQFFPLLADDLRLKHERMAEAQFPFLRATFYRWMQRWDEACHDLAKLPIVLAVGDLHIENFGTWRDLDGRLIWGVNDFDEAVRLPFALDLVRLAVSARLAIEADQLDLTPDEALEAILDGYRGALECEGEAFVLEERHRSLRALALGELREPVFFWKKFDDLEAARGPIFAPAYRVLERAFPCKVEPRFLRRSAGLGSLGRPRVVALAVSGGCHICREAKRIAPSAVHWARGESARGTMIPAVLKKAKRVADPYYGVQGKWLVRRLAPHCSRIELDHLPRKRDELELLRSMGAETANIHLGTPGAEAIAEALGGKLRKKIRRAVDNMTELVEEDFRKWRKDRRG